MQLTTGFLSALVLASSAIPSVMAQRGRESQSTTTISRTQTVYRTVRSTSLRTTTILSIRPWTMTYTTRTTRIVYTSRTFTLEGPVETVTVTSTVSSCDAPTPTLATKVIDPIPIVPTDKGEDPYSTCPPVATVTAMKKCDSSKPPCPNERKCQAAQAIINYNCDCLKAPPRTTTITTACPDECCGGYFPPRYNLLVPGGSCTGAMTAAPEITSIPLVQPPKLAPITVSDDEPEAQADEKKEEKQEEKKEEKEEEKKEEKQEEKKEEKQEEKKEEKQEEKKEETQEEKKEEKQEEKKEEKQEEKKEEKPAEKTEEKKEEQPEEDQEPEEEPEDQAGEEPEEEAPEEE
ncbi:hypothetical protein TWF481_001055 [Arthrobotrys musiformis]|uniref:VWFC domain-containing protein n=1 Tax=Arthrobotrys musiformis TaxID=47236 RepID=A0AAV9WQA3_9PEZI